MIIINEFCVRLFKSQKHPPSCNNVVVNINFCNLIFYAKILENFWSNYKCVHQQIFHQKVVAWRLRGDGGVHHTKGTHTYSLRAYTQSRARGKCYWPTLLACALFSIRGDNPIGSNRAARAQHQHSTSCVCSASHTPATQQQQQQQREIQKLSTYIIKTFRATQRNFWKFTNFIYI